VEQRATKNSRHWWLILSIGTVVVISPLFSGVALGAAPNCQAPPGTSGIDQYCETIPSSTGSHGAGGHGGSGGAIDRSTQRALSAHGKAGKAILDLTASGGAPSGTQKKSASGHSAGSAGGTSPKGSSDTGSAPRSTSNNPLSAIGSAVDSGASAGPAFVWLLIGIAIALSAAAWVGYRRRGREQ
jgi:hypothetical protein